MDDPPPKRKFNFRQEPKKKPKTDDGSAALKTGFGAKMMAKMGYKGTGGLGREGEGIAEPIQVVLRGSKGGVGIVAEKSEQQKREERRKAEVNGDTYLDSDEEDRRERKNRAKAARAARSAAPRPKKTLFELEAAGMHVPLALQSIIDATTGASTPTSGVSLRGSDVVPFENSLQARVRRDLNSFSEAFEELQIEAQAIAPQEYALEKELDALERQMDEIRHVSARLQAMRTGSFRDVCAGLKDLRAAYPSKPLHRESIAVIHPHFSQMIASWSPLEDALEEPAAAFSELSNVIQPRSRRIRSDAYTHPSDALAARTPLDDEAPIKRGTSSSYETMMLKLWLPSVSSAVTQWDVKDPRPMVHLIEVWRPVLPPFVAKRVLEQITRKLSTSVHEWNPRKFKRSPHTWIVEWLPYLAPADLDPKGSGLVADIKRKLRHALQSIDISRGTLSGMEQWRKVFGRAEIDRMLTNHLVPRLASHLRDTFEINPAEQDMAPLEAVFAWKGLLSDQTLGELLKAQFFPKFLAIVHQWLSSEAVVFNEVQEWITWWRDTLGEDVNALPAVATCWADAYTLINQALDLGDARLTDLPAPHTASPRASPEPSASTTRDPPRPPAPEEATFKDVVEEFCADENLLLMPLREAHDVTGLPLFRITASATGRGGAVAYFKGDVLWVQSKRDKALWEPTGLDGGLTARAEGR
ncbi:GC-rich sequence DNA-binding factor-like protein-domain-containing protein [Boeremia exigua]|uniref:GC-rich sequence DNA-binding factor-like protein-domain-containing protein n=1 Tax=Boeremia exigua TaxID=749465 RepID=UPI001E8D89C2|nr:GC-rich sequence DNA-binding factor-like protein-domain-containing protein [Boeremia exigua]KAH6633273.1 GC-rich sequence DNA-binding factor-like protein-domain-containing protein [Boeremia exigua]